MKSHHAQAEAIPPSGPTDDGRHRQRLRTHYLHANDRRSVFVCTIEPEAGPPRGHVLVVPPFGMSVADLFLPAHYLCHNGFRVIRFDARDAVGRSGGRIADYRLSTLRADAELVMNHLCDEAAPLLLLATSLSASVAWRLSARPGVVGVVALVPVVDVSRTLETVTGAPVDEYRRGDPSAPPRQRIFGHEVRAASFVRDMDKEGYRDRRATETLLAQLTVPSLMVVADDDEYVTLEDARAAAEAAAGRVELTVVQGSSHDIGRSVRATRQAMKEVARFCLDATGAGTTPLEPALTAVIGAGEAENRALEGCPDLTDHCREAASRPRGPR